MQDFILAGKIGEVEFLSLVEDVQRADLTPIEEGFSLINSIIWLRGRNEYALERW
jgi:hypothetical protein